MYTVGEYNVPSALTWGMVATICTLCLGALFRSWSDKVSQRFGLACDVMCGVIDTYSDLGVAILHAYWYVNYDFSQYPTERIEGVDYKAVTLEHRFIKFCGAASVCMVLCITLHCVVTTAYLAQLGQGRGSKCAMSFPCCGFAEHLDKGIARCC